MTSENLTVKDSLTDEPPPPLTGGAMGFPFAFALIWPVMRVIAVPLLFRVLPVLLRRIAEALDRGEPIVSREDLSTLVDDQKTAMQAHFESHRP